MRSDVAAMVSWDGSGGQDERPPYCSVVPLFLFSLVAFPLHMVKICNSMQCRSAKKSSCAGGFCVWVLKTSRTPEQKCGFALGFQSTQLRKRSRI